MPDEVEPPAPPGGVSTEACAESAALSSSPLSDGEEHGGHYGRLGSFTGINVTLMPRNSLGRK